MSERGGLSERARRDYTLSQEEICEMDVGADGTETLESGLHRVQGIRRRGMKKNPIFGFT